jgi:hypothetical protein
MNESGKWLFFLLLPIFNIGVLLWIFCARGTEGKNNFGEQPRQASSIYSYMGFCFPVLFLLLLAASPHAATKTENWITYSTPHYSIQFPHRYKIDNYGEGHIKFSNVTESNHGFFNQYELNISTINYKNAGPYDIEKLSEFLSTLGIKKIFSHTPIFKARMLVNQYLLGDGEHPFKDKNYKVKVLSNTPIYNDGIPGRDITAKIFYKHLTVFHAHLRVYFDKSKSMIYIMDSFYITDYKPSHHHHVTDILFNDESIKPMTEHFIASFKIREKRSLQSMPAIKVARAALR